MFPFFCPSLKRSFLYINMDADSWSARLSSASKRYQSALQSRSGKLIHFFFFGLLFLCGIFKKIMEDMWTWCWKLWEFNFYLVICESICLQLMVIIFDSVFLVFCLFLYPSWLKCGICMKRFCLFSEKRRERKEFENLSLTCYSEFRCQKLELNWGYSNNLNGKFRFQ